MDLIKETLIIGNKKAGVGRKDHGNEGLLQNPDTIPELLILLEADIMDEEETEEFDQDAEFVDCYDSLKV